MVKDSGFLPPQETVVSYYRVSVLLLGVPHQAQKSLKNERSISVKNDASRESHGDIGERLIALMDEPAHNAAL